MTREEAAAILSGYQHIHREDADGVEALQMAIDSLGRSEKFKEKAEVVISQLRADRNRLEDTIDKIKAEIEDIYCGQYCENPYKAASVREMALEIIDKYKTESEEV